MPSKYYPTSRTIHPPHLIAKESVISPHGHINKLPLPRCTVLHTFLVLLVLFVHRLYLGPTSSNNQPTHHVLYTTHTVPVTVMMKAHNLHMHMLHMLRSKHWNVYSNRDDMWWQLRDKVKEFARDWTATKWLWELSNHNIPTNNAANHAVLKLVPIVTDKESKSLWLCTIQRTWELPFPQTSHICTLNVRTVFHKGLKQQEPHRPSTGKKVKNKLSTARKAQLV